MNTNCETSIPDQDDSLTATERALAALWSEVLQIEGSARASDDFFALGGSSMTMVMAEYRIMEEFGIELPAGATLGAPTLRELAALIETSCANGA